MFATEDKKIRFFVLVTLVAGLSLVFIYHRYAIKKGAENEMQQLLYKMGKEYVFEIQSELSKFMSISDVLANSISKLQDTKDLETTKGLFKNLIYNNTRLHSVELVFISEASFSSDSVEIGSENATISMENSFRIVKSKSGEIEELRIKEYSSNEKNVAISKAVIAQQTTILEPEHVTSDEQGLTVVPVLSSIYKGNEYHGYIVLYVSVNWSAANEKVTTGLREKIDIYVSSAGGNVIALNKKNALLSEPIEKVCQTCKELIGYKGTEYNHKTKKGYLSVCIPWQPGKESPYWDICLRAQGGDLKPMLNWRAGYSWAVFIFSLLAAIAGIVFSFRRYAGFLSKLDDFARDILRGKEITPEESQVLVQSTYTIERTIAEYASAFTELNRINKAALEGNYDASTDSALKKHPVYKTTKQLHQTIKQKMEGLEHENTNLNQIKVLTEGLDKINQVLKLHHNDLKDLSVHVIHSLVDILKIEMGAVFLAIPDNGQLSLEMMVSYAYSEDRFHKRAFKLGESLVGACAAEKRTIYIKKVPDDYLKIISGLGLSSPQSLLLLPLVFEKKILGVIELGSLKEFDPNKIQFAERASETIANTLSMSQINIRTTALLEQTQMQTRELEERDKKMLEAIDELKKLQVQTAKSESSIRAKLEAMNNTLMMVEYTSKGILLDANFKYLNTMNFSHEDIIGIDVLELLKEQDRAELIKIINTVKNGNFYEGIIRRHTRHGDEKWLMATYTPVFDDKNVVERILFYAIDITRLRKNEHLLKDKIKELTDDVNGLREEINRLRPPK
jgi:PAS domain S-box-containing protein